MQLAPPTEPTAWASVAARTAATLMIATVGGALFAASSIPAPWLSGPATVVAIAAIAGLPISVPRFLRHVSLIFLGALMGSSVSPDTLSLLTRSPVTIAGVAVAVCAIIASTTAYLRLVHRYDPITARLCSIPGALPLTLALAQDSDADIRRVAIIQMIRLVALLVLLPSVFALLGYVGDATESEVATRPFSAPELVELLAASAAGAWLFHRLGIPAGVMFGAMVAGALMFGSGAITTGLPAWILLPGLVVIGADVGSNFAGTDRRLLVSMTLAGVGAVMAGVVAALAVALVFSQLTGLPTAQLWLAYAPGGVDAMSVLALALALEPAFVATHHLARFLGLAVFLPLWMRRHRRRDPVTRA